jgi:hypothetical protein
MTLDAKLWWKAHVEKKTEELELRYKKMYWLIGRNSSLSLHNKLLIYIEILKPIWTYGIQRWGCTKPSNIDIIQFQNKVLKNMVNAPWYIRNNNLHRDQLVDFITSKIQRFAQKPRRTTSPSSEHWSHPAPGQHGHSAQTPEEKTLWATLSDSAKAVTVLEQVLV